MSAEILIRALADRGITIEAERGTIYADPADRLTAEDREAVRALKPAILALLSGRRSCFGSCPSCGGADWQTSPLPLMCKACGFTEPLRFGRAVRP